MEPQEGPERGRDRSLAPRRPPEVSPRDPRRRTAPDHAHDEGPDEGPTDADIERFSDVTQRCPNCKTELYDDAEVCWSCGEALTARHRHADGLSWWVITIIVSVVVAVVIWSAR